MGDSEKLGEPEAGLGCVDSDGGRLRKIRQRNALLRAEKKRSCEALLDLDLDQRKNGNHTKTKGDCSEAFVLAELTHKGWKCSVPWGDIARYDLVIESYEGLLYRVQVKRGRLETDGKSLHFATSSSGKSYVGDADFFAVHSPQLRKVYLVPVELMGKQKGVLRVSGHKTVASRAAERFQL